MLFRSIRTVPDIQGMQLELHLGKNVKPTKSYHREGFQTGNDPEISWKISMKNGF